MKKVDCILFFLFIKLSLMAQDFEAVNSNTVLDFISKSEENNFSGYYSNIYQIGNDNLVNVLMQNSAISIQQEGNQNSLFFNSGHTNGIYNSLDIYMRGNYNRIEVTGVNSISNGMSIELFGNNKTVIINNR
ncbi:hypothetical protein HX088_01845 [Empedobacter sp. 225-1]|uniref:Curlin associated repeat-containing protein n=1 Tax=Empedobacter falsenii TaxID=343874 RepID=A0ABY8V784_9FLAO|nr:MULTISPECIES: hypothetical protein [Empedobacter]MDM1522023.1 hypothetical protein [Empedobacter sp. 225-1]MDM1542292.1 hypothetical protein [Empedobacter sp. 189-2]WIH97531.1 hypothetical protein OBA43_00950 [Empedobacter falsenii]